MTDEKPLAPQLQALEARLAALPPKIESSEKEEILYACAFAAGKKAAVPSLRLWQTSTAVLSVCFIGAMIAIGIAQSPNAERVARTIAEPQPVTPRLPPADDPPPVVPSTTIPKLDAWQVPVSEVDLLKRQLAQLDLASRSQTVSALAHSVLKSESKTH